MKQFYKYEHIQKLNQILKSNKKDTQYFKAQWTKWLDGNIHVIYYWHEYT